MSNAITTSNHREVDDAAVQQAVEDVAAARQHRDGDSVSPFQVLFKFDYKQCCLVQSYPSRKDYYSHAKEDQNDTPAIADQQEVIKMSHSMTHDISHGEGVSNLHAMLKSNLLLFIF